MDVARSGKAEQAGGGSGELGASSGNPQDDDDARVTSAGLVMLGLEGRIGGEGRKVVARRAGSGIGRRPIDTEGGAAGSRTRLTRQTVRIRGGAESSSHSWGQRSRTTVRHRSG